jgi:hypothetical protein
MIYPKKYDLMTVKDTSITLVGVDTSVSGDGSVGGGSGGGN